MKTQEARHNKLFRLRFKSNGFESAQSQEYLEEFKEFLLQNGLSADSLLFSGIDGSDIAEGGTLQPHEVAFVMNLAGWRDANASGEFNPVKYALKEGHTSPCLAVYDRDLLVETYGGEIELDHDGFTAIKDWEIGPTLSDLPLDHPVDESVAHKNHPTQLASDALLGFIFLDET